MFGNDGRCKFREYDANFASLAFLMAVGLRVVDTKFEDGRESKGEK